MAKPRRESEKPRAEVLTPAEESKIEQKNQEDKEHIMSVWIPKTGLGRKVKEGTITSMDQILDAGRTILEPEIVEVLIPGMASDLLMVGQSKGKFGGGSRRVFRQTQKKTQEGNKPSFATMAVVGNRDGYVGIGFGKSRETVPAREKAVRKAKLAVFKVPRGCGSWRCSCLTPHSIPFTVQGKCGSVVVTLMPAPKGKGLICEKEMAKILALAGIKDVWSRIQGQAKNKINLVIAAEKALKQLTRMKITAKDAKQLAFYAGMLEKKHHAKPEEALPAETSAGGLSS